MKKIGLITLIITMSLILGSKATGQNPKQEIILQQGEKVWAGVINDGHLMPFSKEYSFNLYGNNNYNQVQPLILTNKGQFVWSKQPFNLEIKRDRIIVTDQHGIVETGKYGSTLKEVQRYTANKYFPASGSMPDTLLFSAPQYNTWIELNYNHNQADILKYAKAIVENGMPPGVLMIDDTWQEDYGLWDFHPGRFPDPKAMIDELHKMGFKVMLWICPFVSADQYLIYNTLKRKKAFLIEKVRTGDTWQTSNKPAMITWWNGVSAELDFTNPEAVSWFDMQLNRLVEKYNIDGFKFDAGDTQFYPEMALSKENLTPNEHCELYAQFGLRFPLNEYRACWKMGGQPLAQRLSDKNHTWKDLQTLIPNMALEGLCGYTFSCPDMIGGGNIVSFENLENIDQDLIVRSAQCHALMPMMQFSVAPWRILDTNHLEAIKKAVKKRMQFSRLIIQLARNSAKTGEPILNNLEYVFPGQGLEAVNDQFMLGETVLVAPMVMKGYKREVALPKGRWKADDGTIYKGGQTISVDVPLERLPYFERL